MMPQPDLAPLLKAIAHKAGLVCSCCSRPMDLVIADYMIAIRKTIDIMEQVIGPDPGRRASGAASVAGRGRDKNGRVLARTTPFQPTTPARTAFYVYIADLTGRGRTKISTDMRIAKRIPISEMEALSGKKMTRAAFLKSLIENRRTKINAK